MRGNIDHGDGLSLLFDCQDKQMIKDYTTFDQMWLSQSVQLSYSLIYSLMQFKVLKISKVFQITIEFLQNQLRRVHVVPVTKVACIFVGIYRRGGLFS